MPGPLNYGARGDYGLALVADYPSFWKRVKFILNFLMFGRYHFILAWKKPITEYPAIGIGPDGKVSTFFEWKPDASSPLPEPKTVWDHRKEDPLCPSSLPKRSVL